MNNRQNIGRESVIKQYSHIDELPKSGRVAWEMIHSIIPFKRKTFIKLGVNGQAPYPYFYSALGRVMFDALELRRWFENMILYRPPIIPDGDVLHMDGVQIRDGYITGKRELWLLREYKHTTYMREREARNRKKRLAGKRIHTLSR